MFYCCCRSRKWILLWYISWHNSTAVSIHWRYSSSHLRSSSNFLFELETMAHVIMIDTLDSFISCEFGIPSSLYDFSCSFVCIYSNTYRAKRGTSTTMLLVILLWDFPNKLAVVNAISGFVMAAGNYKRWSCGVSSYNWPIDLCVQPKENCSSWFLQRQYTVVFNGFDCSR